MTDNISGARRRAIRIAALAFTALAPALLAAEAAQAQTEVADKAFNLNIPAQTLARSMATLSTQTGVQVVYSDDAPLSVAAPAVRGRMTVEQALARVTAGTGFTYRFTGPGVVTLVRMPVGNDGEQVAGVVQVEGVQGDSVYYGPPTRGEDIAQLGGVRGGQEFEAQGLRPKVATVASGSPTAIEDIPRSLSVMTQDQLQKQDITTIADALQRLPGVTLVEQPSPTSGQIFSRGYPVDRYQVDGGAPRSLDIIGNGLLNLDAYERVELVRGPNAVLIGEGSAGGSINLVRKRPGMARLFSADAEVGSFDRFSLLADYSVPSIAGSSLAFRGLASWRSEGAPYENYKTDNLLLYGIFDAPLGDQARLEWGVQYNRLKVDGSYIGIPRYLDGPLVDLSRDYNIADPRTFSNITTKELFANFSMNLRENWDFEAGLSYQDQHIVLSDFLSGTYLISDGSSLYDGYLFIGQPRTTDPTQLGLDAKLTGRFETFGLRHDVFASINYNHRDDRGDSSGSYQYMAIVSSLEDLLNPTYAEINPPSGVPLSAYKGGTDVTSSIVLSDTVSWRDTVSLNFNLRHDSISNSYITASQDGNAIPTYLDYGSKFAQAQGGQWRPSYGITFRPVKNLTIFGNYSSGFTRQDNQYFRSGDAPNFSYAPLTPSTYNNKEVGAKFATGKWLASLSAYHILYDNVADYVGIGCPPNTSPGGYTSPCYTQEGKASKSKGVDFEVAGEILEGLSVVGSINYNKTVDLYSGTDKLPLVSRAPNTMASLYLDWSPSFFKGLSLQFGGRYRSRYYEAGARTLFDQNGNPITTDYSYHFDVDPYAAFDLGAEYQVSDKITAKILVENITDKDYLSTVSASSSGGNFYGRPRSFMFSLKWKDKGEAPENGLSPTTGLVPFGDPADWYAAFDAGLFNPSALHAKASGKSQDGVTPVEWNYELDGGPAFAVRLGYHFSDHFRSELEFDFRNASIGDIGGGLAAPYGVCGADQSEQGVPFDCDDVPGNVGNLSLMANVLYDFGKPNAAFRPFVGAGVGLSRTTMSFRGKLEGIGGDTPWQLSGEFGGVTYYYGDTVRAMQEFLGSEETRLGLALQGIAGASLRLSDRLDIDLTYRFNVVPNLKWGSYNQDVDNPYGGISLTPRIGTFEADYKSSMLTVGIRWAFGKRD